MVMNVINFLLVLSAGISMPSFFIGWDIFTVELGLLRGTVFDILLLLASNCVTYILFTPLESKTIYGEACSERVHRILNCDCIFRRREDDNFENAKSFSSKSEPLKNKHVEKVKSNQEMRNSQLTLSISSEHSFLSNDDGTLSLDGTEMNTTEQSTRE